MQRRDQYKRGRNITASSADQCSPASSTTAACAAAVLAPVKEFGYAFIARFTQIDYMAFIALDEASVMLGVVRLHVDANHERGRIRRPRALRFEGTRSRLSAHADDH
jgi:hypothetical protein